MARNSQQSRLEESVLTKREVLLLTSQSSKLATVDALAQARADQAIPWTGVQVMLFFPSPTLRLLFRLHGA